MNFRDTLKSGSRLLVKREPLKVTPALRAGIERLAMQSLNRKQKAELDETIREQSQWAQRRVNRAARWLQNSGKRRRSAKPPRHIQEGIIIATRAR